MVAKSSVARRVKAIWSRLQVETKLLLLLGVLAGLVTVLAMEDGCRAGLVVALMREPPEEFKEVSMADAEFAHVVTVTVDGGEVTRPFGFINDRWGDLKRLYRKGDCLYEYRIDCGALCGSGGYVLIRDGKAVYSIQTWVS